MSECMNVRVSMFMCVCVSARVLHEYVHSVLDGTLQVFIVFNNTVLIFDCTLL